MNRGADATRDLATTVAFDVGPLVGRRTGIGMAVAALADALAVDGRVTVEPYVLSFRATLDAGVRRLPLPAALAHRTWSRVDRPRVDRWVRPATVVHGTNYVVPPTGPSIGRLVSVYDCWFLEHPELADGDVVRAGRVLDHAVRRGATVHACSEATARAVASHWPDADVRVVLLGPLPLAEPSPTAPFADLDGRPFVLSIGTRATQEPAPPGGGVRRARGDAPRPAAGDRRRRRRRPGSDRHRRRRERSVRRPADRVHRLCRRPDAVVAAAPCCGARLPVARRGFGFPLLDAMAARVPIVATAVGSIPEVASDAALLVDASDHVALAAALDRALTDDAERARLVAAGTVRRAQLSWRDTADRIVSLYHELSGGTS
ncbi:MAG: glycosyltransferase [Ilumatobacteraceae bacterium]